MQTISTTASELTKVSGLVKVLHTTQDIVCYFTDTGASARQAKLLKMQFLPRHKSHLLKVSIMHQINTQTVNRRVISRTSGPKDKP